MKALIIDDSRAMRRIIGSVMGGLGFETIEAEDGIHGFARIIEFGLELDVVLVDWNMPNMNGLEFVEKIRSEAAYAMMKVVMVTTETEPARMAQALMAGVDEFVMKPFTPEVLADKLRLIGVKLESAIHG